MQITFGMNLDGAEWSPNASSLRELAVGPLAFLAWLESRLALSGKDFSLPERIEQYRQKVRKADCPWCRKSFELDSWSTAKQLLSWRDELMQTRWDGKTGGSLRLEALAAIEQTEPPLAPGIGDRLQRIITQLADLPAATLTLVEPAKLLPNCWQELITCLENHGWTIHSPANSEPSIQELLEQKISTGALHVFTEKDEFTLAEHLAGMLAQKTNAEKSTVICQGSTHVLDQVLHRHGCGSLGESERSPAREALCILPLLCEIIWEPFSPRKMLEFLSSFYCPVKGITGRNLRKALLDKPGIKNAQWNTAWNSPETEQESDDPASVPEDPKKVQKKQELLKEARPFLETRFSPTEGIPAKELKKRCNWLDESLKLQSDQRSVKLPGSHIATLKQILERYDKITRLELFRILDTISSSGVDSQNIQREVTGYRFFTHPGAMTQPADIVLWWNFIDPQDSPQTRWTEAEIQAMEVLPDDKRFQRENFAWHNTIRLADKVFFFLPSILQGEAVFHHPFMDEINATIKRCTAKPANIITDCSFGWPQAISVPPTEDVSALSEPVPESELPLGANQIKPEHISFTSLNALLSCPAKWLFKYWVKLKETDSLELPTGPLLMGSFVHSIVEKLFNQQKTWEPEDAKIRAGELFDELVEQEAAELAGEEKASVKARNRDHIQQAVYHLCQQIKQHNLTVVAVEKKYPSDEKNPIPFHNTCLTGAADIVLENPQNQTWILDLKWSGKVDEYLDKIENGTALQLATYARMEKGNACDARCAYFLLPKFLLLENEKKQNWPQLWGKASDSYQIRMEQIRNGQLSLTDPDTTQFLALEAECTYCEYALLCHFKGQKKIISKTQKKPKF